IRPTISITIATLMNSVSPSAGSLYQPVKPMTNVQALHSSPISRPADRMGFIESSRLLSEPVHLRTATAICEAGECDSSKRVRDEYLPGSGVRDLGSASGAPSP